MIVTRWGKFLTLHPYPVILTAITTTALCSLGFLVFRYNTLDDLEIAVV